MPHCCPQKQQCVLTRRSGSALVDRRNPDIADRWGPNRSMIFSGSAGSVAPVSPFGSRRTVGRPTAPCAALRQSEQRSPAARADLLVVFGTLLHLVRKPQLSLDRRQVADHHRRRKPQTAAPARRLLAAHPRVLV